MSDPNVLHGRFEEPAGLPPGPGGAPAAARWRPDAVVGDAALALCRRVERLGGRALIVGGWVRDAALGRPSRDEDLEVFGLNPQALAQGGGPPREVGADFTILKIGALDVSFPRAAGGRGGAAPLGDVVDPHLPLAEAARRRDFTINALAWDPLSGALYDPAGGLDDLRAGRLRHVDPVTLAEDPVRALRAAQLVARLGFQVDPETLALLPALARALPQVPAERRWVEVRRLLLAQVAPWEGFAVLWEAGAVAALWPAIAATGRGRYDGAIGGIVADVTQPRGPDGAGEGPRWSVAVRLAVLGQDLDGPAFAALLDASTREGEPRGDAPALHRLHGELAALGDGPALRGVLGGLARQVPLSALLRVGRAVAVGAGDAARLAELDRLEVAARGWALWDGPPAPLLKGRDVAPLGVSPGPAMGALLERVYRAQLDGVLPDRDAALALAARLWEEEA